LNGVGSPQGTGSFTHWVARSIGVAGVSLVAFPTFAQQPEIQWEDAPPPSPAPEPKPPDDPPQATKPAGTPTRRRPIIIAPPPVPPRRASAGPARRAVELVPELALAWAHCTAGAVSNDSCSGVSGRGEVAFNAVWRVTPHLAWGGALQLAVFRNDPPERANLSDATAAGAFLGFLGRVYLLDQGVLDPYLQLGLGGGVLGTAATGPDGEKREETGAGPAVQIGVGADFFVASRLKLGPSLSYTQVLVDKIRRCRGRGGDENCADVSKDEFGYLNSFVTLGVRLSILLGAEM
jgi:hypothetical protein